VFANPEVVFGGTQRLLSLIELIYSAVNQPAHWSLVLEEIAELVDGESTALWAEFPEVAVLSLARMDPFAWDRFTSYYASVNVFTQRADAVVPDAAILYSNRVITDNELEQTEFYNDYLSRHDMYYAAGLKVPLGDMPAALLSCQRPKFKGPFEDREGLVFETLLPHLQRALTLYLQFNQMQSSILGLETALDVFEHAVFGLNRDGRVVLSNRLAEALARAGEFLLLINGAMASVNTEQDTRLQSLLTDAVAAGNGIGLSSGGSMFLDCNSGKPPLRLTVTPLRSSLPGSVAQVAALVFVSDPALRPQPRATILRALYALTPSEARVADLLFQGLEVRAIGEALGMTLESARFRVKQVLAKTETRRQTELMRLMLSLPGQSPDICPNAPNS
jgi:DNA-binding CsgD family transcriptional regulator